MIQKVLSKTSKSFLLTFILLCTGAYAFSQRQMEYLDRGVVAVRTTGDSAYIGWRMLGTEPDEVAFNLLTDNS